MSELSDNLHRGVRAIAAFVAGAPGASLVDSVLPEVGSWFTGGTPDPKGDDPVPGGSSNDSD